MGAACRPRYGADNAEPGSPTACPFPPDLGYPENHRLRERDVSHIQRLSLRLEIRMNSSIYQRLIFV